MPRTRIVHDGRISKVCDTESTRYAMSAVHVTPAGNGEVYLTATDSRCLAVVKADGDCDDYDPENPPLVPAGIFPKNGTERNSLRYSPATEEPGSEDRTKAIEMNGADRWETPYGRFQEPTEGRFPRCLDVMPDAEPDALTVTLDVKILDKLAKAVGEDGKLLTLVINPPQPSARELGRNQYAGSQINHAIPVVGTEGFGVIMPVSQEGYGYARDTYLTHREDFRNAMDRAKYGFCGDDIVQDALKRSRDVPAGVPISA